MEEACLSPPWSASALLSAVPTLVVLVDSTDTTVVIAAVGSSTAICFCCSRQASTSAGNVSMAGPTILEADSRAVGGNNESARLKLKTGKEYSRACSKATACHLIEKKEKS